MTQTSEAVLRQQQQDAARRRAEEANKATRAKTKLDFNDIRQSADHYDTVKAVTPAPAGGGALATRPTSAPATPPSRSAGSDTRTPQQKYLDEIAPSSFVGTLVKFSKEGKFVIAESGEEISPDKDFIALCDEVLVGWIKFNGQGEPPDRVMGLHYDGFVMPERETLGDLDPSNWPAGLSGEPADVWQHQINIVLQDREVLELYTFATSSTSGRRAVGNLLRHYERLRKSNPDDYPIVRLKPGGFNHRDPRVGWVATPTFAVVGRAPKASAAKPDSSPSADLQDKIPF
jgi:hypothetical protein